MAMRQRCIYRSLLWGAYYRENEDKSIALKFLSIGSNAL
jgi:hypothetical protein